MSSLLCPLPLSILQSRTNAITWVVPIAENLSTWTIVGIFNPVCKLHYTPLSQREFGLPLILEALYEQGRAVESPLTVGAKILYFESGDLIFKGSLNFFAMPLEKSPATFNLTELHKNWFPHAFNKECNFSYVGPFPPEKIMIQTAWTVRNEKNFLRGTTSKCPPTPSLTSKWEWCCIIKRRLFEIYQRIQRNCWL